MKTKNIQVQNTLNYTNNFQTIRVNEDAQFLYMAISEGLQCYLTFGQIEENFYDFDMTEDLIEIENLKVGESWCVDGNNIYIRIKD